MSASDQRIPFPRAASAHRAPERRRPVLQEEVRHWRCSGSAILDSDFGLRSDFDPRISDLADTADFSPHFSPKLGSTGDPPVPPGHWPGGRSLLCLFTKTIFAPQTASSLPVGGSQIPQWRDGSPVLPIPFPRWRGLRVRAARHWATSKVFETTLQGDFASAVGGHTRQGRFRMDATVSARRGGPGRRWHRDASILGAHG